MNRLIVTAYGLLLPLAALGHVGSPNVFFEGAAGPYLLRVVIRPPAVLPGIAQADVRVTAGSATRVSLQPVLWEAGAEGAPAPVPGVAVAGETNLFNAALWLFRGGSYNVRVTVDGPSGRGMTAVPLNSAVLQRGAMPPAIVAALVALGAILFAGAVWLAGAAARDGTLAPGNNPAGREHIRARIVSSGATVLLAGAIGGGAIRWQRMDREFRNNALYQPLPVAATVRTNGTLRLLQLTSPNQAGGTGWDTLVADHGKLMHLFLVREPDCNAFAHLHPVRRDPRTFENVLPPLPAGAYRLYAEVTHENGLSQTLIADLSLADSAGSAPQFMSGSNRLNEVFCLPVVAPAGNAAQPFALDADDSWHTSPRSPSRPAATTQASALMGGYRMVLQGSDELMENRETSLRFAVFTPAGEPATLQPYMGMLGHAVVRRSDGEVFTHLHPVGTISMAAQELFARREGSNAPTMMLSSPANRSASPRNEVAFPYAFPRPGDYHIWAQVRIGGRVLTGVFTAAVKSAR